MGNNNKNGAGVEYFASGHLKFSGTWKDDSKTGKGKEYNENGNIIFEGNYANDLRAGYGVEYYSNGEVYKGIFENGKANGNGILYTSENEKKFEGEFKDGLFSNG